MTAGRSAAAREEAHRLGDVLRRRRPELVEVAGTEIGSALEQQLFFALRDGLPGPSRLTAAAGIARLAAASAGSLLSLLAPLPTGRPIVVLVREPAHYRLLARLEEAIQQEGGEPLVWVRVGRAARVGPPGRPAPRLAELLDPASIPPLASFQATVAARLGGATVAWPAALRQVAARELPRIALGALALGSVAARWQPALLLALDEVGTWARLLPAVGRRHGIPTLDLPHAEAADAAAIRGAGYDRMAVYGARAAAILEQAGIGRERIVPIGAPRFDPLLAAAPGPTGPTNGAPRRVVYAAQYVAGAMTAAVIDEVRRAAVAVAAAAAPAELMVVPHPADPAAEVAPILEAGAGAGVTVRLARDRDLQDLLPGAWVLVTGWSNSVFEAAIAGVPSITIDPRGTAPVDFAADGLALGAADPESAAGAARSLLDEGARRAVVERARGALPARIGALDGRATERAAQLVLRMARAAPGRPS